MIGEPGIGKSRLAAELAKFAALQGIRTATVSCQRSTVDRPLSVLIDLAPSLRDMPGALGCSQERADPLAARLGRGVEQLLFAQFARDPQRLGSVLADIMAI